MHSTFNTIVQRFNLDQPGVLEQWLSSNGLDASSFDHFLETVAVVDLLEDFYTQEIEHLLPVQRMFASLGQHGCDENWVQFNMALTRGNEGAVASAVCVFEKLLPMLVPETRDSRVHCFFLMRKDPDLRLRIEGPDTEFLEQTFRKPLAELMDAGVITEYYPTRYEPEIYRFGGHRLLGSVHSWFDADSLAWLRLEPLLYRQMNQISRDVLSLTIINDLLFAVLKDYAEVWDVWRRLADQHGFQQVEDAMGVSLISINDIMPYASETEQNILRSYEQANLNFATELEQAARSGNLTIGRRNLLSTLVMFHWNRFGLSRGERVKIINLMLHTFRPHQEPE
jgi:thiopeptide-type bacteriocin biosynthesis protein